MYEVRLTIPLVHLPLNTSCNKFLSELEFQIDHQILNNTLTNNQKLPVSSLLLPALWGKGLQDNFHCLITLDCLTLFKAVLKGQIISKRLLVPLDSSKKQTNKLGFFA